MERDELMSALEAYGTDVSAAMERFLNDTELYEECLQLFFTDDCFPQLAHALEQKNYKAAFDAAHTLKGVSGNLGVTPVFDVICVLVEQLRANQYEHLDVAYANVLKETETLKSVVRGFTPDKG